jgi:hypothetical protein
VVLVAPLVEVTELIWTTLDPKLVPLVQYSVPMFAPKIAFAEQDVEG